MMHVFVAKDNGLGRETALPLLRGIYEPHVVEIEESQHYFLLARDIRDNKIVVLGRAEISRGHAYAADQAVAATKQFFGL